MAEPELTPDQERQAAEREIRRFARVNLLGRMAGIKSINRNLKAEDAAAWQFADDNRRRIEGLDVNDTPTIAGGDEDVEIMAGGNVTVYYREPPSAPVPPIAPPAELPAPTMPEASRSIPDVVAPIAKAAGMSLLTKAAIAALGVSGVGLPAAALTYWLTRPDPVVQQPATPQPSFGIGLLPPSP